MAQPTPELTPFTTDSGDELPVGTQLSWRLRALIATGRLSPGDALPGVRPLAEWAGVNVNTVRAVYRRLEQEGLIVTQQGLGSFVAAGTGASTELEEIATEAIERAREAGADPRELAIVAMVCASVPAIEAETESAAAAELPAVDPGTDEIEVRRELRRQIARLEGELSLYVRELGPAAGPGPRRPEEGRVAGVEELERTRDALLDRLATARDAAERLGERQASARVRREDMLADPTAHRWELVTAEDAGEPGCVNYRVVPRFGPLGALMNWWRVKVSGGCPLAAPLEAARGDTVH